MSFILPSFYSLQSLCNLFATLPVEKKSTSSSLKKVGEIALQKVPLATNVQFVEGDQTVAAGSNDPQYGIARVTVESGLIKRDSDAAIWLIEHELSHIKMNDSRGKALINLISYVALTILCVTYPIGPFGTITLFVGLIGIKVIQLCDEWLRERRADQHANSVASLNELKGGIRFLKATQKANQELCRMMPVMKFFICSNGNERFDFSHPSYSHRIEMINQQPLYLQGSGPNDKVTESEKINALASLQIEKFLKTISPKRAQQLYDKLAPEMQLLVK